MRSFVRGASTTGGRCESRRGRLPPPSAAGRQSGSAVARASLEGSWFPYRTYVCMANPISPSFLKLPKRFTYLHRRLSVRASAQADSRQPARHVTPSGGISPAPTAEEVLVPCGHHPRCVSVASRRARGVSFLGGRASAVGRPARRGEASRCTPPPGRSSPCRPTLGGGGAAAKAPWAVRVSGRHFGTRAPVGTSGLAGDSSRRERGSGSSPGPTPQATMRRGRADRRVGVRPLAPAAETGHQRGWREGVVVLFRKNYDAANARRDTPTGCPPAPRRGVAMTL